MAETCFSKVTRGKETIMIWHIEGWNCEADFDLLKSNAYCLVQVGPGAEEGAVRGQVAQLRFNFAERRSRQDAYGSDKYGDDYTTTTEYLHLSLVVEQVSSRGDPILVYDLNVESVDDKLNPINEEGSIQFEKLLLEPGRKGVLKEDFIKLETHTPSTSYYPVIHERPEVLRLKITVTPIFVSTSVEPLDADSIGGAKTEDAVVNEEEQISLCQGLKGLLAAEENYADLKLETKDGMKLSAHRVILAARSPVLRELQEKEVKQCAFTGTIKLPDVNAKPMVVIIHWMYTGELQENAGKCMEEVVNAAIAFQLTGLIKILDKKVITFCNPENMLDLFRVAKKNGMASATEDIANFIKENLK